VTVKSDLACEIDELVLVDSHEHLLPEQQWMEMDILQDLFFIPYIQADLLVAGAAPDAIDRLRDPSAGGIHSRFADVRDAWEAAKHTGYGEAVRLIASVIYGIEEITPESLQQGQARLKELQQPGERLRLLSETARLDHVQIDDLQWPPRIEPSRPDFFLHDLSFGFKLCNGDIELEQILSQTGIEVRGLEDLRVALAAIFQRFAPSAVAVKSPHAYVRTLRWEERSDAEAARALSVTLNGGEVDEVTRLVLGDWCWARVVELAIEHNLPFKLHTGYLSGNGPMPIDRLRPGNLCALLARYPDARFVLMHIAYPYSDELVALAKHYPNVYVDLCWAWAIDPYSSADFLRRFLHAVPANKLFAFGGDNLSPTNTVAYSIQARRWLTRALEAEVAAGDLTEREAITIARRIMRENQYACFDLEGTRAAACEQLEAATTADTARVSS
jgi:predicted TIM-barrel fold metal-dependent hydrolase